jgi:hypothetical protein
MKISKISHLIALTFFCMQICSAQKVLSKTAIHDFANSCEFQVRYNQNGNFLLVTMMQHVTRKTGSVDQAYNKFISTEADKDAREMVFEAFNEVCGGDQVKMNNYLFNWGLSAANAKEISGYISTKYAEVIEAPKKAENGLFKGTKKFTDGDWNYVVTVKQDSITLKLYPSATNMYYKNKIKAQAIVSGKIEEGKIVTSSDRTYKFENGNLYELNNEGDWNEYREVPLKK